MVTSGEVKKLFNVALDINRPISNREFTVVEGDTGNVLHITLSDDGNPVELDGCRVMAIFSKSDGTTVSQDSGIEDGGVTIGGEGGNEITIALSKSSVAPGMVECEIQIYSGEECKTLITSAKFNFKCRRGIFNGDTIESVPQYPLLTGLIAKVSRLESEAEALVERNVNIQSEETQRRIGELAREASEAARMINEQARLDNESRREEEFLSISVDILEKIDRATGLIAALEETIDNCAVLPAVDRHLTLSAAWLGDAPPYTQSISITGLEENANITVGLRANATIEEYTAAQAAALWCDSIAKNEITIRARGKKPHIPLPITVRIFA